MKTAVDKTTRRALSRFGAFVRTTARRSIRKKKTSSEPGKPPASHTGLLKRFIFFGYQPQSKSVVIGPAKLNKGSAAPSILEYGGKTKIDGRKVNIKARPYMGSAFEKEKQNLPKIWQQSVR